MMTIHTNANMIKAHFINALLDNKIELLGNDYIIGQEIMYGTKKMLADLLLVNKKGLIAIEIKSKSDTTQRLKDQIENYNIMFDYTYVVTTINHLNRIHEYKNLNFGIIVLSEDGSFKVVRKGRKNKKLCKKQILDSIPCKYLKEKSNLPNKLLAIEVRELLMKKSIFSIKSLLYDYYQHKLQYMNSILIPNKKVLTHFEDVSILSMDGLHVKL